MPHNQHESEISSLRLRQEKGIHIWYFYKGIELEQLHLTPLTEFQSFFLYFEIQLKNKNNCKRHWLSVHVNRITISTMCTQHKQKDKSLW